MLLPKRVWKDIPGYEGKYQVSNTGQVKSLNYRQTGKTKILKLSTSKDGYKNIGLCKNGKRTNYQVHRLVAQAFLDNPNNYKEVNHKDENKANNTVWNLEYCDHKYNCNYGTFNYKMRQLKSGENNHNYGKGHKIKCIELNKIFNCIADANEWLGKPRRRANISLCASRHQPTAYSYHWEYVEG